jgi:hypothetical protein
LIGSWTRIPLMSPRGGSLRDWLAGLDPLASYDGRPPR